MKHVAICVVLILLLFGAVAHAQDPRPQYPASDLLTFPDDHLMHIEDDVVQEGAFVEWLYYTGVMEDDATGDLWGFQITLFVSPFLGQASYGYEVALSDTTNETFWHHRGIGLGTVGTDENIFDDGLFSLAYVSEDDAWAIAYEGDVTHYASGDTMPLSLSIMVDNDDGEYIVHAEDGLVAMGSLDDCAVDKATLDGYSWYYSLPTVPTTMTATLGDQSYEMTGSTWFDHQWGNFIDCNLRWNWWGLRLDDGTTLILTQILDQDGNVVPELPSGAIYYPDGTALDLLQEDVTFNVLREWTNPLLDINFTLEFEIVTPDGSYTLIPYFDDQTLTPETIPPSDPYWEGIVRILDESGEQIGRGYFEVVPTVSGAPNE